MSMKNKTKGIIGGGFVGQILKRYYSDAKVYDINGKFDGKDQVLAQDIIFLAFNLTDNGLNTYELIAEYPKLAPPGRIFIIKSTFIPGTCSRLEAEFPQHTFVYNCEFLTEATAYEDFIHPQFQILGCTHQALPLVNELFELLPDAPIKKVISPLDAEVLKHAFNSYYGTKVIWFNQLYDACQKLGSDFETIREIMIQNKWIGDSHSIIFHKSYRGFGTQKVSKCIPKDLSAFVKVANIPLLKKVEELNEELNKMQGL